MFVPEDLKLNRFKFVRIPPNRDYVRLVGASVLSDDHYSGDNVAIISQSKIDSIVSGMTLFDSLNNE